MTERPEDRFLNGLRAEPRPEFAAHLAAQLGLTPAPASRRRSWGGFRLRRWRTVATAATAAVLVAVVLLSAFGFPGRAQPVSAREVLRRAATVNVDDLGAQTFHIRMESESRFTSQFNRGTPVPGSLSRSTSVFERRVALPNQWRTDVRFASQPFLPGTDRVSGSVSDGATEWIYNQGDALGYEVRIGALRPGIAPPSLATIPLPGGNLQPGQSVGDPGGDQAPPHDGSLLGCYPDATITGTATVAGRRAYMIALGADACAPGYQIGANGTRIPLATVAPAEQGRQTLWVDTQWYVFLKMELLYPDGSVRSRGEVTAFEVNTHIPDGVFTFDPPAEVANPQVTDRRPQPYQIPASAITCDTCIVPGLVYGSPTPTRVPSASAAP